MTAQKTWTRRGVVATLGASVFGLGACAGSPTSTDAAVARGGWSVGDTFPNLSMHGADGKHTEIRNFRGKPLFVNFWASWCAPCLGEWPDIEKLYNNTSPLGVQFVMLNMYEPYRVGRQYAVEEKGYTVPLYDSSYDMSKDAGKTVGRLLLSGGRRIIFDLPQIPQTFLIDESGKTFARYARDADFSVIEQKLRAAAQGEIQRDKPEKKEDDAS